MKILVLNERDPEHPRAGGAEAHVQEVFGRLAARGHSVIARVSAFEGCASSTAIDGVRYERAGRAPFSYALAATASIRATRAGQVDVVVECLNKLPYFAPIYCSSPVLALCHHLMGETVFQQARWPVAAAVRTAEHAIPIAYRGTPFVAISPSTRLDLEARGVDAKQIEVQLPGVRKPATSRAPISEREPLVAYVGRLEPYKRVDVLLEAMRKVCTWRPEARLVVVGRGSQRSVLERRAHELGVASKVRFVGFVGNEERDRWLARARVGVCPSVREGFGLSVIEANTLGTPNVASDVPGLRDSVRHNQTGLLFAPNDVGQLAMYINDLLANDELAERMSRASLEWAQLFDWNRAAEAMERSLVRITEAGLRQSKS